MSNETKHTPVEMICEHRLIPSLNYGQNDVECSLCGKCWVELNGPVAASGALLNSVKEMVAAIISLRTQLKKYHEPAYQTVDVIRRADAAITKATQSTVQ